MTGLGCDEIIDFMGEDLARLAMTIEAAGARSSRLRLSVDESHLRPGRTVSGPTLMTLADAGVYVAIFATVGKVPLAVTSQFSMNFLRRPREGLDLIGESRLLKVGRVLAVGDVHIYSEGSDEPVAHAVATYALPQASSVA